MPVDAFEQLDRTWSALAPHLRSVNSTDRLAGMAHLTGIAVDVNPAG